MSIDYIGEHLILGSIGEVLVWISFVSAMLSAVCYFTWFMEKKNRSPFTRLFSRGFYGLHALSLVAVVIFLYVLIFHHYFEYAYVWQYSSRELPIEYIISCFWAGQEGSFLVWALFQALVGLVVMKTARDWEPGVMTFFALSQFFVSSMLLGVHIGSWEIGSSPFTLLRETVETIQGTIFTERNYLSVLTDGNGLNPLLENIWMTIHPPILFLGYALALVPYSYAMAAIFRKDYRAWIKVALPWTIIAIVFLGAGILLGGAWAYVSLTFGGFWAWDPVENSSLVPWITLVAALHFMLISRKQNHALLATFIFTTLSYILVLYASYLTRSGVLSETSAHSFGDNGMTVQLTLFLLTFFALSIGFISLRAKAMNLHIKEALFSREFWIFVGAIILVLSAFQIIFTTSIPVYNSLLGMRIAPPVDAAGFYNRWQTPYAMLIVAFIGLTQFFQYKETPRGKFPRKIVVAALLAMVCTIPFILSGVVRNGAYILLVFFILFSLIASILNFFSRITNPWNPAAVIAHVGLNLFLLGVVITFSNARVISSNTSGVDLGDQQLNRENLLLVKGDTLFMTGYYVTYVNVETRGNTTTYQVDFLKRNKGIYSPVFSLNPSINRHPRMGNVHNPDTRHFLLKDYYAYIATTGKENDYIVIKTIINPYINILWLGSFVMMIGFVWAWIRRSRAKTSLNPNNIYTL